MNAAAIKYIVMLRETHNTDKCSFRNELEWVCLPHDKHDIDESHPIGDCYAHEWLVGPGCVGTDFAVEIHRVECCRGDGRCESTRHSHHRRVEKGSTDAVEQTLLWPLRRHMHDQRCRLMHLHKFETVNVIVCYYVVESMCIQKHTAEDVWI